MYRDRRGYRISSAQQERERERDSEEEEEEEDVLCISLLASAVR